MKNKSIIIIISVILVLSVVGIGFYFLKKGGSFDGYLKNSQIMNNKEVREDIKKKQEEIDLGNVDTSKLNIYQNEDLGFEVAYPGDVFNKKFKLYEKDKGIIRFYDIECEYNEAGMPASDCININIHKKEINDLTESEKNTYSAINFDKNKMLNGSEFVMEIDERYIEKNKMIYGANTVFKGNESYYLILIGGAYFDFTPDLIEKYKIFISTFKILK